MDKDYQFNPPKVQVDPIVARNVLFNEPGFDEFLYEELTVKAWLSQKRAKSTRRNYEREIRSFFKKFPGLLIKNVTDKHLAAFLFDRRQLSATAQNFSKNVLSSLLNYCVKIRYINYNVADALDPITVPIKIGFRALSEAQVERLIVLSKALPKRDHLLVKVLFYTGMRVSEVVSLKWSSSFPSQSHMQLTIVGKGGKVRSLLVANELWREIEELRGVNNTQSDSPIFIGCKKPYAAISTTTAWRSIKRASKIAGLSDAVSPHFLRHSHAVLSLRGGSPISTLQHNLGHASLKTTGIYLNSFPTESSGDFLPKFEKAAEP